MSVFAAVLAVSLIVPFSILSAQQPLPVEPGAQVRVTAPDCGLDKRVATGSDIFQGPIWEALSGDTLVVPRASTRSGNPVNPIICPLASVTRLEVIRGRQSHPWRGAGIGFLAGASIGAVWGYTEAEAYRCGQYGDWGTNGCVVSGMVLFGVPGVLFGAIAGAFVKTDRWEEVPLDRLRVSFAPKRDGFAVGVRVAF